MCGVTAVSPIETEGEKGQDESRGEEDESEQEVRPPVRMVDPKLPTEQERKDHSLTHLPYRNWCPECVRG